MNKTLKKIILVFSLMCLYSNSHAQYSGIWASDCEVQTDAVAITREKSDANLYSFSFCAGFKCIPAFGFRGPVNLMSNNDIAVVSSSELIVKGKRLSKCIDIEIVQIPKKHISKNEISSFITGRWEKVADIKNGIESKSRYTFFFNADGSYGFPGSRDQKISTYKIDDNKLIISKSGQFPSSKTYVVRDVSSKLLLLEVVNKKRPDLEYVLKLEKKEGSE